MEPQALYLSTLPALLAFCAVLRVARAELQPLSLDTLLALVPDPSDPLRLSVQRVSMGDTETYEGEVGTVLLLAPVDPDLMVAAEREARLAASDLQEAMEYLRPSRP